VHKDQLVLKGDKEIQVALVLKEFQVQVVQLVTLVAKVFKDQLVDKVHKVTLEGLVRKEFLEPQVLQATLVDKAFRVLLALKEDKDFQELQEIKVQLVLQETLVVKV
jgi:hypothetical protein